MQQFENFLDFHLACSVNSKCLSSFLNDNFSKEGTIHEKNRYESGSGGIV
jgi:hypothetical protein